MNTNDFSKKKWARCSLLTSSSFYKNGPIPDRISAYATEALPNLIYFPILHFDSTNFWNEIDFNDFGFLDDSLRFSERNRL